MKRYVGLSTYTKGPNNGTGVYCGNCVFELGQAITVPCQVSNSAITGFIKQCLINAENMLAVIWHVTSIIGDVLPKNQLHEAINAIRLDVLV
jgi:hypothetical protein